METLVIIGWLLLTLIPMVGYLVVSGINAKINELGKFIQAADARSKILSNKPRVPVSKLHRALGRRAATRGKLLRFKRK